MKRLLTLLFILILSSSYSQLTDSKFHFSAKYSYGQIDTARYNNFSLNAEWHVHEYIGLNYNFDVLFRNDKVHQIHTPMGLIGGPLILVTGLSNLSDSTKSFAGLGVLLGVAMLALPDGISFHIPLAYRYDLSPYANVLGIDFVKNRITDQLSIKYACSFGIKSSFLWREKYTITGFVETRKVAGIKWSVGGGMALGFVYKKRKNQEETDPTE